jgi:class I fructose-bisphosphate aldolase
MPLVVWSYPRGSAVKAKGGQNSFYAIDYAARMAMEQGADVVKLNLPHPEATPDAPEPYDKLELSQEDTVAQVVASAGRSLVVLSGGSRIDDDHLLNQTRYIMEAGGTGVIYGRNVWQRGHKEAMEIVEQIKEIMLSSVNRIP